MTTRTEIQTRVIEALSNVVGRELTDITDDTRLFDDLNLDSTSVLGLLMELEDAAEVEVDPDELEQHHLETVGSLTDFVTAQMAQV